ncbi:MAG: tyrosine-type recombinase/integrase, partial [Acidobacteria bacterium]|nr:tyrosine-type recombinase/integrase [Acidobacteriota bacterium]
MNENNTDSIEIVSSYLDQYKASSESAKLKQLGQIVELITPTRNKQKHKLTHDELVAKVYSFDWTQMSGQFVDKVNAASLRRGYSTSTRHSLIIVCRGIAEKCWLARLIDRDEFERIKQTGKGMLSKKDRLKKLNKEVSVEDFQKLLAACLSDEKPIRGLRDYALITMLYGTGLRASEAISVRLKNIDFENGTITIKGKGDLTRTVYTVDGVMDAIKKWLSVHTP